MTAKIGGPTTRTLNFHLVPKVIKIVEGRVKVRLAAIVSSPGFSPKAELLVALKNEKKKIHLNGRLKKLLKKISWDKDKLKPLIRHLKDILDRTIKNPPTILDILDAFLKKSCSPDFKVKVIPRLRQVASDSINLSLLPPPPVANFALLPVVGQQDALISIPSPEEAINVAITSIASQEQAISFALIPREVKAKNGKIRVTLSALLSTAQGLDRRAKITASIKHGKSQFSYGQKLLTLLAENNWTLDDLQPMRNFLDSTLKAGRKDPGFVVGILSIYLKGNIPQNFIVRKAVV